MSDREQTTTTQEVKSTRSAKEISKWSMVIAAFWIGILSIVKALWYLFAQGTMTADGMMVPAPGFGLSMNDIIISGLALAAVFTPVYFSIFLEKIRDIKTGGPVGGAE